MGVCIGVSLDKEIPDADLRETDGKTLADCADSLDQIGKANGLSPPFSSFILDPESMAENLPEGEMIEEKWYDANDGLRVVTGLLMALEAPDGRLRRRIDQRGGIFTPLWRILGIKSGMEGKWADYVIADLKELERCLRLAAKEGARFYLLTY